MAQRLEVTMSLGKAEVSHLGKVVEVNLPEWFQADKAFFDETALLNHCVEHDILLSTLQAGFAQHLIDIRSKARPASLPPTEKGGNRIDQQIEQASAQARVNEYYPEPQTPTVTSVSKAGQSMANLKTPEAKREALKIAGFTDAQIDALMSVE